MKKLILLFILLFSINSFCAIPEIEPMFDYDYTEEFKTLNASKGTFNTDYMINCVLIPYNTTNRKDVYLNFIFTPNTRISGNTITDLLDLPFSIECTKPLQIKIYNQLSDGTYITYYTNGYIVNNKVQIKATASIIECFS